MAVPSLPKSPPPPTTQPFPANKTTVVVNHAIDGVFGVAVKGAQVALVAADPAIFGNPIVKKIDDEVIQIVAGLIYKQFAQWVSFSIIDFQDSAELTNEQKALVALKAAQALGDPRALIKALADFDKAAAALTHIDGRGST